MTVTGRNLPQIQSLLGTVPCEDDPVSLDIHSHRPVQCYHMRTRPHSGWEVTVSYDSLCV